MFQSLKGCGADHLSSSLPVCDGSIRPAGKTSGSFIFCPRQQIALAIANRSKHRTAPPASPGMTFVKEAALACLADLNGFTKIKAISNCRKM